MGAATCRHQESYVPRPEQAWAATGQIVSNIMHDNEISQRPTGIAQRDGALPGVAILTFLDLLPGDILLYRPMRPGYVQRRISAVTESPYAHAAIYVGDGKVAEALAGWFLQGVVKNDLTQSIVGTQCVGVLRSQLGFKWDRPARLKQFVDDVCSRGRRYNLLAILNFKRDSRRFFDNQLQYIHENYGKSAPTESFARRAYFCSAFVVAYYVAVGIIGERGQVAYPEGLFSPGHLARDPTFGWLLGYLVSKGGSVPEGDPLSKTASLWRNCPSLRWW
jgi:hypothetical protein